MISACFSFFLKQFEKPVFMFFVTPKAHRILHKTAQRALARWACAQHTGFLIVKIQYYKISCPIAKATAPSPKRGGAV